MLLNLSVVTVVEDYHLFEAVYVVGDGRLFRMPFGIGLGAGCVVHEIEQRNVIVRLTGVASLDVHDSNGKLSVDGFDVKIGVFNIGVVVYAVLDGLVDCIFKNHKDIVGNGNLFHNVNDS